MVQLVSKMLSNYSRDDRFGATSTEGSRETSLAPVLPVLPPLPPTALAGPRCRNTSGEWPVSRSK